MCVHQYLFDRLVFHYNLVHPNLLVIVIAMRPSEIISVHHATTKDDGVSSDSGEHSSSDAADQRIGDMQSDDVTFYCLLSLLGALSVQVLQKYLVLQRSHVL